MKDLSIKVALLYLRFLARLSLKLHKPTVIGIAGSVGKTSAKNALFAILKDHFPTKEVGNSETGIPLGILGIKPDNYSIKSWLFMLTRAPFGINFLKNTKYLIAEMGIDDPLPPKNMSYLLTILKPHIAILLHESAAHTEQFEKTLSKEEKNLPDKERLELLIAKITHEDAKIAEYAKIVVYNADNTHICNEMKKIEKTKLYSFGEQKNNFISYGNYSLSLNQTTFSFSNTVTQEKISLTIEKNLLPKEYQSVLGAAIATALSLDLKPDAIKHSLEKNYASPKGRSSLLLGTNNTTIIDSSYNASKDSVLAFLTLLNELKQQAKKPIVFVFGDMRELGEEARIEHEAVAKALIGIVDYLYLVGPLTREYVLPTVQENETGFKEIRWFDNAIRVGEFLREHLPKDSIVLFKGSQNTIYLEEAVKMVLKNKEDGKKLCRQEDFWLKKKHKFFRGKTL